MSKHTLHSALAIAGLMSASAMVAVPQLASAQTPQNFLHSPPVWSVVCADGEVHSLTSGVKPTGRAICGAIGYNGGEVVSNANTEVVSAAIKHDAMTKDLIQAVEVSEAGRPILGSTATAVTAVQADAVRGDPVGPGEKPSLPTLNCSNSRPNPATLNLSTTPSAGWALTTPGGTAVAVGSASNVSWSAVPGGQWVGPVGASTAAGLWTYLRQVRILPCPKGRPARLSVSYRADNGATLRVRNSSSVVITSANQAGTANYGFLPGSLTNHNYTFPAGAAGIYTIAFEVRNSGGPTGLSARVNLTR